MSKDKTNQAEAIDLIEPIDAPVVNEPIRQAYFFPNVAEGRPFGGEFASREEALIANDHYLKAMKKENKHG